MHIIYVPTPALDIAKDIATTLLAKRLIACANIFSPSTALYVWEGKLEETQEYVLLLKTPYHPVQIVIDEITKLHPYTCPCIMAIQADHVNAAFLEWANNMMAL